MTSTIRSEKATKAFVKHQNNVSHSDYKVAGKGMSVDEKLKILQERGQEELIEIFKDWQPRTSNRRKKGAPLDQRVSITVSASDRRALDNELNIIKNSGTKTTLGALIRSRAMSQLDLVGWSQIATEALDELDLITKNKNEYNSRIKALKLAIEEDDDTEQMALYNIELAEINSKLDKIVARGEKRSNRLQGRMSMPEAETVKWRAQRLCISTSDYLRIMIFGLEPNSIADAHMSLDSKRRFYISIIDVANNGWGTPPTIYECSQCETYMEEIHKLRDRVKQLESFS